MHVSVLGPITDIKAKAPYVATRISLPYRRLFYTAGG